MKLDNKLFEYQRRMSAYIHDADVPVPHDWVGSRRIDGRRAGEIYRRNLFGGVLANLASSFATTQAYIGRDGFRSLGQSFIDNRPASSPVFRTLSVQFPGFIGRSSYPAPIRQCLVAIAILDFLSQGASTAPVPMDKRFVDLYRRLTDKPFGDADGLYRLPEFHPETILALPASSGSVVSVQSADSWSLVFTDTSSEESDSTEAQAR